MISKNEYDEIRGLWFKCQQGSESICHKCSEIWDNICIAHEPDTEFHTLSKTERYKIIETMNEIDEIQKLR